MRDPLYIGGSLSYKEALVIRGIPCTSGAPYYAMGPLSNEGSPEDRGIPFYARAAFSQEESLHIGGYLVRQGIPCHTRDPLKIG